MSAIKPIGATVGRDEGICKGDLEDPTLFLPTLMTLSLGGCEHQYFRVPGPVPVQCPD
jgi:hypothetical protein